MHKMHISNNFHKTYPCMLRDLVRDVFSTIDRSSAALNQVSSIAHLTIGLTISSTSDNLLLIQRLGLAVKPFSLLFSAEHQLAETKR